MNWPMGEAWQDLARKRAGELRAEAILRGFSRFRLFWNSVVKLGGCGQARSEEADFSRGAELRPTLETVSECDIPASGVTKMDASLPFDGPVLTVEDGIAIIVLNRPDRLNAIDYATIDALMHFLDVVEGEDEVRAVILTGAGERAFSSGADIASFAPSIEAGSGNALREFVRRGQNLTRRIESFPKPVIAAVHGIAYGAGCEIIEACHLAVADETATFGKPEINLGFPPPFGGTQRLPRHVGRKRALQMILTGDPIDASDAVRIGLVNEVVGKGGALRRARELATAIAGKSPAAVAACLASVTRGLNLTIDEGLAVEAAQFATVVGGEGVRQGIAAFLARRAVGAAAGQV